MRADELCAWRTAAGMRPQFSVIYDFLETRDEEDDPARSAHDDTRRAQSRLWRDERAKGDQGTVVQISLRDPYSGGQHHRVGPAHTRALPRQCAWWVRGSITSGTPAPGAHWGPAFLPWHREFLRQFEIALQKEHPQAFLPYWDSTLDEGSSFFSDSVK